MKEGDKPVKSTKRSSLRLLGSVGEPINPEAWLWYYNVVGEKRCPIVDTWWQTETGATLISPLPGATDLKPGSASKPLPGIIPALLDSEGNELIGPNEGNLCISDAGQVKCEQYLEIIKGLSIHILFNMMVIILQEMVVDVMKMDITG